MTTEYVSIERTVTRGRALTITLWTAQIVLAAFFAVAAAPKLLGDPSAVATFETIGFGQWFRYLTGACELAGAIGLLIPRLSGLAALGLAAVMVGATATNLFLLPGMAPAAVVTALLCVVFLLIAWARRPETFALVGGFAPPDTLTQRTDRAAPSKRRPVVCPPARRLSSGV